MASVCVRCGNKISLLKRFSGTNLCPNCERKALEEQHEALTKTQNVLKSIWKGELPLEQGCSVLESFSNVSYLSLKEQEKFAKEREIMAKQAFRGFAAEVLEDDILSVSEEEHLFDIAKVVGINQSSLQTDFRDIFSRLIVARINDGRLPLLDNAKIMLKANEVAHSSMNVTLMKWREIREYQGGYTGVSFRVAKGVRFSTGNIRGKSVTVGQTIEPDDSGILTITSYRAVFVGEKRTVEIPFAKLVSFEVFTDGIKFSSSNRKIPVLFKLEYGEATGALVNAAAQKLIT